MLYVCTWIYLNLGENSIETTYAQQSNTFNDLWNRNIFIGIIKENIGENKWPYGQVSYKA